MQFVAPLVALLVCARAAETQEKKMNATANGVRSNKAFGQTDPYKGCLYEGRWFREGAVVSAREWCLRCVCARGALSCRRRACVPLPDPPPHRCHLLHRKDSCCPELHCPDGITMTEHGASARFDTEDDSDIATPATLTHACVEGGTVYSAGSAMSSSTACEQCFCLGGARKCVRPKCLPPPPGCRPRPAPGACCPQRYYCEHVSTNSPNKIHPHDCHINNKWVGEGERVTAIEVGKNCTRCFCLRGVVECTALACAPPLLGCTPVLRPGQCCPHQYRCSHGTKPVQRPYISDNLLISARNNDDRSFNSQLSSSKQETTTKTALGSATMKSSPATSAHIELFTTKVKRKTNEAPPSFSKQPVLNITSSSTSTETLSTSTESDLEEGSVKVIINGTINCTAEISSTSFPLNFSLNDTKKIEMEAMPRLPNLEQIEAYTFNPNDIITNGDLEENDTFTINVTSSLRTNSSKSTPKPELPATTEAKTSVGLPLLVNITKKTKGDYDYDYTEATLPPSLPNLKIIPFVAADAVVEENPVKESPTFPILEREDKYPVYYPSKTKETPFATRREDVYPVFSSKKDLVKYPGVDLISSLLHDYAGIGKGPKEATKTPSMSSTFYMDAPSVNLFSPPVETEGGFLPKGPSVEGEYYAVFPSTSPKPPVPHLTTSMQLDDDEGECVTADGRLVSEGASVSLACSVCTCVWQKLHCSPRPCHTPPKCSRRLVTTSSADMCCGDLICDQDITSTTTLAPATVKHEIAMNVTKETVKNHPEIFTETSLDKEFPLNMTNNMNNNNTVEATTLYQNSSVSNATFTPFTLSPTTEAIYKKEVFNTSNVKPIFNTSTTVLIPDTSDMNNDTVEYEEEEDEEEEEEEGGFSFGNVLKLLLSDSYETTTATPKGTITSPLPKTTTVRPMLTTEVFVKPSIAPFVLMPPYTPPKKIFTPNAVNRIDHLVLGEATAIKKTTAYSKPATQRPLLFRSTTKTVTTPAQLAAKAEVVPPRPSSTGLQGIGSGLLKLAGCNIYGRMYRVGRIIAELSTPCQECRCTEVGVQCTALSC